MLRNIPVIIREVTDTDISFIYSTWLKSYRHGSYAADMSNDVFFSYHKEIIAKILDQSNTEIKILVNEDDHDQIYGYAVQSKVGGRSITHFVYIKFSFRKLGLASRLVESMDLFPDTTNFITHLPRGYKNLKAKYGLEYNPYILADVIGDK